MYAHHPRKHTIDFLFSILLFLLFTASALLLILIGARVYQNSAQRMEENYTVRTALAYITEKVRQSDESGAIELSSIQQIPTLVLRQDIDGEAYSTYIYEYGHSLRELFIKSSSSVTPEMGHSIVDLEELSIEETDVGCFRLTATDANGASATTLVYPSSQKEAAS